METLWDAISVDPRSLKELRGKLEKHLGVEIGGEEKSDGEKRKRKRSGSTSGSSSEEQKKKKKKMEVSESEEEE